MIRPQKKDYDLNDHFEVIRLAKDLIKYIDYLELEKHTSQEKKLHVDLVSKRKKYGEFKKRKIEFIHKYKITSKTKLTADLVEKARKEIGYSIKTCSTDIRSGIQTLT